MNATTHNFPTAAYGDTDVKILLKFRNRDHEILLRNRINMEPVIFANYSEALIKIQELIKSNCFDKKFEDTCIVK